MIIDLPISSVSMLFIAGIVAGAMNAIAGGGTFFTFPVLIAMGVPPVIANASNAVAVWPGHALAAFAYRDELKKSPIVLTTLFLIAVLGGIIGAILLLYVGNNLFTKLIPFLILFATFLFAFGAKINLFLKRKFGLVNSSILAKLVGLFACIYGGFFGAGLGIMIMSSLALLGIQDIQQNNALKNYLATVVTTISAIILIVVGFVSWRHTIVMFLGAVIGGAIGAIIARRVSQNLLNKIVISIGVTLTIYYLYIH